MTDKLQDFIARGREVEAAKGPLPNLKLLKALAALKVLREALDLAMTNGHYNECLPGKRGRKPSDASDHYCSHVCVKMREALARAEEIVS
jgi:hypothetical protein